MGLAIKTVLMFWEIDTDIQMMGIEDLWAFIPEQVLCSPFLLQHQLLEWPSDLQTANRVAD